MRDSTLVESFVTTDGNSISFKSWRSQRSDAPRLVLIHPLALDSTVWSGVTEHLTEDVEILAIDCPGHGRSGREGVSFTLDFFARSLADCLDHVGWATCVVAGCSMGGCVAQAFAGRYPSRLTALGLVDTTAWYGPDADQKWRERASVARERGFESMTEWQKSRWFSDGFRNENPALVDATAEIFVRNDIVSYEATCHMLGSMDLRCLQSAVDVPVAIVVGEEDYAAPVAMSRQMHEAIAGSTLTILPGVRHLAPVEAPKAIAAELKVLLGRVAA